MKTIIDENQNLIFLYKLIKGEFSQSFAIRVAEIAGLEKTILTDAFVKAKEFQK